MIMSKNLLDGLSRMTLPYLPKPIPTTSVVLSLKMTLETKKKPNHTQSNHAGYKTTPFLMLACQDHCCLSCHLASLLFSFTVPCIDVNKPFKVRLCVNLIP